MPIDDDALGALLDELDIGLELNSAGPAIAPLIDLLIGGASQAALHVAAADAVEALWDAGLAQEVRTEFEELRRQAEAEDTQPVSTIDCALAELGAPARENHVAHALVWRAAVKLVRRANRNHERMAELERSLERAPAAKHRRVTLPIAAAASLAADVGDEEAAKAVAEYAFSLSGRGRPSRRQRERATPPVSQVRWRQTSVGAPCAPRSPNWLSLPRRSSHSRPPPCEDCSPNPSPTIRWKTSSGSIS